MGAGSSRPAVDPATLPPGSVITAGGRVSGVHQVGQVFDELPFTETELIQLDNALTDAIRQTLIRFNVYIGDLGNDPAAGADELFPRTPDPAHSVLLAVSPNQRRIEVRTGRAVADRADHRVAQLGVTAATSAFKDGDLIDGLVSAVRVMSSAIG
ncbi:DUF5130 domain-containing protein [Skermania piniformis]|uniref:DUF5130 domain-containing protein n=1 Tax=Skermania pinensis TaxID=39122 RepID=A0ABX8SAL1_9ACTN|nr:DUF5130 domain-containing protein [Skermania piniformis]QXQ14894.1 DUF5130 domain-containing protein [Skermania piniformis]